MAPGYPLDRQRLRRRTATVTPWSTKFWNDSTPKENLVVLGQRGSGKSTVCRAVACRWRESDHGPIFYQDSRTETTFDAPVALVIALQYVTLEPGDEEAHPLDVVEDCVDEETQVG